MTRYLVTLHSTADRVRAAKYLAAAPMGTRVEFKAAKRTLDQNSLLWSCLTDIAAQLEWYGKRLRPDDWKLIMLDGLKRELNPVPNIDGTGFVNLGRSSSDLTKAEMSDLIELIYEFGARHNVQFHDSQTSQQATLAPQSHGPETLPAVATAAQPEAAAGSYSEVSV